MRFVHYIIVVVIALIVVYVVRYIPMFRPITVAQDSSVQAGGFQTFIYIDSDASGSAQMVDLDGDPLPSVLVAHKGDSIVFVNRMSVTVTVGSDPGLFPPGLQSLAIPPYKRKHSKVRGNPDTDYSLTLAPAGGGVTPPKVKVGQDP